MADSKTNKAIGIESSSYIQKDVVLNVCIKNVKAEQRIAQKGCITKVLPDILVANGQKIAPVLENVSNGVDIDSCIKKSADIATNVNNMQENGSNDKEANATMQFNESKRILQDNRSQVQKNIGTNGTAMDTGIENGDFLKEKPLSHASEKDNLTKQDQHENRHVQKCLTPPAQSLHKTKVESARKPESTFIKVDYLKPAKMERNKESVSRVLNFASDEIVSNLKEEEPQLLATHKEIKTEILSENKAHKVPNTTQSSDLKQVILPKSEIKKEPGSYNKHSKSSSQHSSSSHHKSHSSSHHKSSSSSSHRSRHGSGKECSRCYRRSKIKRNNIGIQVRPDEEEKPKPPTKPLEFEASHRVGVNRRPVVIDTNLSYLKYGRFYHIEVHPNGGASIIHMYQDELDTLTPQQMTELVDEFFELTFSEDENGFAYHVMGVVHDGARYLPDLLEHMAENYSNLTVKSGVLGRNNDIETCTMLQYYDQVLKSYDEGTVRHGPLHQISLVGKVHEEVGGYFPDLLGKLENSPFLKKAMPWGKLSIVQMDPRLSNDGPILWIRPGEQLIPTADLAKTPLKRQRRINELRNLQYLPRVSEARETMFEDRTKAHADHVGMGHERQTTAAVGKLKHFRLYELIFIFALFLFRSFKSCALWQAREAESHHKRCCCFCSAIFSIAYC